MIKHFSQFFACLLMVLIPLHAIAASNMTMCNSMMQLNVSSTQTNADMPCHEHMDNTPEAMQDEKSNISSVHCAAMCASLHVISIMPGEMNPTSYLALPPVISMPDQAYTSITQANLLRPPIFLT
jgi:hypothetical protein